MSKTSKKTARPGKDKPAKAKAASPATKKELMTSLLGRAQGASIADLTVATGWLPHTTRAALSGLRKAGRKLVRDKAETGESRYRLA